MNRDSLREILYVDDEPDIREIVQMALGLVPTFSVTTADSGSHALQSMQSHKPDLVLLDVMMPNMDGPTTLQQMRSHAGTAIHSGDLHDREGHAAGSGKISFSRRSGRDRETIRSHAAGRARVCRVGSVVMAPTPEELQNKLAQIAVRYLDRVGKEIEQLRGMVDAAATGDMSVVREIEALTHRMHGSGAMLQFDEISGHAGTLERMAADFVSAGKIDGRAWSPRSGNCRPRSTRPTPLGARKRADCLTLSLGERAG